MNNSENLELFEELELYSEEIKENKKKILNNILLNAIYSLKLPQPIPLCNKKIILKELENYSDELIGQIIGKDGKHKKSFLEITGVNLELDHKVTPTIILSKYNPMQIEKTTLLINTLLKKNIWTKETMKKEYKEIEINFKKSCIENGSKILKTFLKFESFSDNLAEKIGILKYTFSFSQSILDHSFEVAQLCANVASQLGLNSLSAKRAGFFHDIGKSISNYEDHVEVGKKIAIEEKLDDYIINAIESHHGKIRANNSYSLIVKCMDKISAGRVCARPMQNQLIDQRKNLLMTELKKISWIEKILLKNAGNLIQIFIKLKDFDYKNLTDMKEEVKNQLKKINDKYTHNFQIELLMIYQDSFLFNEK